jgi:hypothetical protein
VTRRVGDVTYGNVPYRIRRYRPPPVTTRGNVLRGHPRPENATWRAWWPRTGNSGEPVARNIDVGNVWEGNWTSEDF